jgi:hypothetical protein
MKLKTEMKIMKITFLLNPYIITLPTFYTFTTL